MNQAYAYYIQLCSPILSLSFTMFTNDPYVPLCSLIIHFFPKLLYIPYVHFCPPPTPLCSITIKFPHVPLCPSMLPMFLHVPLFSFFPVTLSSLIAPYFPLSSQPSCMCTYPPKFPYLPYLPLCSPCSPMFNTVSPMFPIFPPCSSKFAYVPLCSPMFHLPPGIP